MPRATRALFAVTLLSFALGALLACRPREPSPPTGPAGVGPAAAPPPQPCPPSASPPPELREGFLPVGTLLSASLDTALEPVDADALQALVTTAQRERSTALIVIQDGRLLIEEYFGQDADRRQLAMSVSKSVTALALGMLVDAEHLQLDAPLSLGPVPEWADTDKQAITLRHLMAHASGLAGTRYNTVATTPQPTIEAHGVQTALEQPPGTRFEYNNNAYDLLGVVARRAHPEKLPLDDQLQATLFGALGVRGAFWLKDRLGDPRAAGELLIRPIDLAKIGQLVLDDGRWQGEQLVSANFVATMLAASPLNPSYGMGWWRNGRMSSRGVLTPHAYRADGYLGQYVIVVPSHRLVVVRMRDPRVTSWDDSVGTYRELVWDVLALAGISVPPEERGVPAPAPSDG